MFFAAGLFPHNDLKIDMLCGDMRRKGEKCEKTFCRKLFMNREKIIFVTDT
jgi:hypothetical protein